NDGKLLEPIRIHREEGVDIRTQAQAKAICGDDSVTGVELESGEVLAASLVVVGIGIVPNTDLAEEAGLAVGDSILFRGPSGERISLTRQERNGDARDFIALSSTCPHLGCQVHWEAQNDRFFCPCHNGTFDASGVGTGGPPGDAGQSLPQYELKIDSGMLFISVPMSSLAALAADDDRGEVIEEADEISGPGHDPCLAPAFQTSEQRSRKA
ncbi:MAG: Rieske 2Fe-2S domain-containing protein, partial [Acidobacteria bacterium]|nr:Rieske 2Fe-2S domain-containing protein [Acidobacteriota bacterium]